MVVKYPIRYKIEPKQIDQGTQWISLTIENVGDEIIEELDVRLNSLDSYYLWIYGTGEYIASLAPEEEVSIPFQVSANGTTGVYASLTGERGGEYFYWESPNIKIKVGEEAAEIRSIFVLTHPYTTIGKTLEAEATITGLTYSEGLDLEFWVDTPEGDFKALGVVETKPLEKGEEARYSVEMETDEEGLYTVYAYLYDDGRLLSRETDRIRVSRE